MHKCARLATTAGMTVLTFGTMSGIAQADPLGDLTGGLTDTVGGVVDSATGGALRLSSQPRRTTQSSDDSKSDDNKPAAGVGTNGPVRANARVEANSSPDTGTQVNADVNAGVGGLSGDGDLLNVSLSVGLDTCGFAPEECGGTEPPEQPEQPGPGTPPPPDQPGPGPGPSGNGSLAPGATEASMRETLRGTLPVTGGPLGALAGLGLATVLTGSAAVAASRYRAGRSDG